MSNVPEFVMEPELDVALKVPDTVDAPNTTPLLSTIDTTAPVTPIVPKLLVVLSNVTLEPLAVMLVVPGITNAPVCVTAPSSCPDVKSVTVAVKLPDNVNALKAKAELSVIVMSAIVPELAVNTGVAAK